MLVVTSPYHTRRAAWAFSRVLGGTGIGFGVHPSDSFYVDYDRWWSSPYARRTVAREYAKLWLYGLAVQAVAVRVAACAGP